MTWTNGKPLGVGAIKSANPSAIPNWALFRLQNTGRSLLIPDCCEYTGR